MTSEPKTNLPLSRPLIEEMADWILSLRDVTFPEEVLVRAKLLTLDTIGCALAAVPAPEGIGVLGAAESFGEATTCTVIGSTLRLSVPDSVFTNSSLVRTLDFNDLYNSAKSIGHPSDIIPVALALAELVGSSGSEVLTAIVIGYELYGRACDLFGGYSDWDPSIRCCFPAAAIAGLLLGLNSEQLADALGHAVSHSPTLGVIRAGSGQMSGAKNVSSAFVTSTATFGALLARHGITGPHSAFDSAAGFGPNLLGGLDLSSLVAPIDSTYKIMEVSIKAYPAFGTSQALIGASVLAHEQLRDRFDEITEVVVTFPDIPRLHDQSSDPELSKPQTRETADHSFRFLAALGLKFGDVNLAQYAERLWENKELIEFMELIRFEFDKSLNGIAVGNLSARLKVTCASNETFNVECLHPPGHHQDFDEDLLIEKFIKSGVGVLARERCLEIVSQVTKLEQASELRSLLRLTAP